MSGHETLWFLNHHVTVKVGHADSTGGISVLQVRMVRGDGPPLHVHHTEDEIFHVEAGEVRFRVGDEVVVARAGQTLLGPRGVPHGFRGLSDQARMLVITRGGFEQLVRSAGRPAETDDLPDFATPTAEMQAELAVRCAAVDIELLGPPID